MTKKQQNLVNKLKRLAEQHARVDRKMLADINKIVEKIGDLQEVHEQKCASRARIQKVNQAEYSRAVNSAIASGGLPMGVALAIGAPKSPAANILNN